MERVGGCGIDLVEIARIDRLLSQRGRAFTERWFSTGEVDACLAAERPGEWFAACLAAKEAVVKVLGMDGRGPVPWRQIEIRGLRSSSPQVQLAGVTKEAARGLGLGQIEVAVTIGAGIAAAVAISSTDSPEL